jgi:uroporphyrinogen-III synthase
LRQALAGGGDADDHAVEVAVARLRTAIDAPRVVQTVVKRGYRLAYEPERLREEDGADNAALC